MKHAETARRLQLALNLNGLKAHELSEKSGVSKFSISQYVNGVHAPSNISAGKMAKVLEVSPLWLMGFSVPMQEDGQTDRLKAYYDKLSKLDAIDRAKIEERIDTMLESDKYGEA